MKKINAVHMANSTERRHLTGDSMKEKVKVIVIVNGKKTTLRNY